MVCSVIDGVLRSIAGATSAIVVLSFALFAVEDVRHGAERQQSAVDPGAQQESRRAADHTTAREAIDDANDVLLKPFGFVTDGRESQWARRGVPALIGLLVYGFGLASLARWLDVRSHTLIRHPTPGPPPPAPHSKSPPGAA